MPLFQKVLAMVGIQTATEDPEAHPSQEVIEAAERHHEDPTSKAAVLDAKTDREHAEAEEPVAEVPVNEPPSTFEPDDGYDPRIPRGITDEASFRQTGPWDMRPYGLYSSNGRLYACTTQDERQLAKDGKCGLVGTRFTIDGTSLMNKVSGVRTLPVKRWDELRDRWTSEDAPYIQLPDWKLPRAPDGYPDLSKVTALPRSVTKEKPGEVLGAIEGSGAPLLPAAILLAAKPIEVRRRQRIPCGRAGAAVWHEQCTSFLCPAGVSDGMHAH